MIGLGLLTDLNAYVKRFNGHWSNLRGCAAL